MRKCRWLILSLALLLAAALAAGCGGKPQESQKEEAKEEDKLQIGLSFDSFELRDGCGIGICCFHLPRALGQK